MSGPRLFRKVLAKVFENFCGRSDEAADRISVAEDNDLATVFKNLVATAADFALKAFPADAALYIAAFAADNGALAGGFGLKHLLQPDFGG